MKHCDSPRFFNLNKIVIAIHRIYYNFRFIKIAQAFSCCMDRVVAETPCCFVRGVLGHVGCCRHRWKFVLLQYKFLCFSFTVSKCVVKNCIARQLLIMKPKCVCWELMTNECETRHTFTEVTELKRCQ